MNDRQYRVWRAFGISAWPTIVLIDPAGGYVGSQPGEFLAGQLAPVIDDLVAQFDRDDAPQGARLDRRRLELRLPAVPVAPLRYPGRVLALPDGRLFVSDTGHDRILELQLEGAERAHLVRVIGTGRPGFADGSLDGALFDHPEGLAHTPARLTYAGLLVASGDAPDASSGPFLPAPGTLFVADEENHSVRVVDLDAGVVTTLAGSGRQARRVNESGTGTEVSFSSPWDVELVDGALVVAMAGAHQLWRVDLESQVAEPLVGTGREDITDGPSQNCTLAQPHRPPPGRRPSLLRGQRIERGQRGRHPAQLEPEPRTGTGRRDPRRARALRLRRRGRPGRPRAPAAPLRPGRRPRAGRDRDPGEPHGPLCGGHLQQQDQGAGPSDEALRDVRRHGRGRPSRTATPCWLASTSPKASPSPAACSSSPTRTTTPCGLSTCASRSRSSAPSGPRGSASCQRGARATLPLAGAPPSCRGDSPGRRSSRACRQRSSPTRIGAVRRTGTVRYAHRGYGYWSDRRRRGAPRGRPAQQSRPPSGPFARSHPVEFDKMQDEVLRAFNDSCVISTRQQYRRTRLPARGRRLLRGGHTRDRGALPAARSGPRRHRAALRPA